MAKRRSPNADGKSKNPNGKPPGKVEGNIHHITKVETSLLEALKSGVLERMPQFFQDIDDMPRYDRVPSMTKLLTLLLNHNIINVTNINAEVNSGINWQINVVDGKRKLEE